MAYSAQISRQSPGCFVFIIDQSYSMTEQISTRSGVQKAAFVAEAVNRTLYELVRVCTKGNEVRHYFDVSIIGYGAYIGPAFAGSLSGTRIVPISDVLSGVEHWHSQREHEIDGAGRQIEYDVRMPIWLEPTASGGTPMYEAFELACQTVLGWISVHQDSFPPIVLHITDGEWTGTDPSGMADRLLSLSTQDGNVLMFHLHISSSDGEPLLYPTSSNQLADDKFARALFDMSSTLTPQMVQLAQYNDRLKRVVQAGSHGYVFNGGAEDITDFLQIGTQPANLASPS